jgi:hypothetical protein
MNQGKTVFAQLLQFVPFSHFEHLVDVYQANKGVTAFSANQHWPYCNETPLPAETSFKAPT